MGVFSGTGVTINAPLYIKGVGAAFGTVDLFSGTTATTVTISSNTGGSDAIIPAVTTTAAGVMTASDKTTFDSFFGGSYFGPLTLNGDLSVSGATTFSSTATFVDNVNANSNINCPSGNVTAAGVVTSSLSSLGGFINIGSNISMLGYDFFSDTITTETLTVNTSGNCSGGFNVSGTLGAGSIGDVESTILSLSSDISAIESDYVSYNSQSRTVAEERQARRNVSAKAYSTDKITLSGNINMSSIDVTTRSNDIFLNGYTITGDHIPGGYSIGLGESLCFHGPGTFSIFAGDLGTTLTDGESYTIESRYDHDGGLFSKTYEHGFYSYSSPLTTRSSFKELEHNVQMMMSTGIKTFNDMSASSTPPLLDVGAVKGQIVDNTTDPDNPVVIDIDYPGATDVAIPNIATPGVSHVYIDSAGSLQFVSALPSPTTLRQVLYLGSVGHLTANTITSVNNLPTFVQSPLNQLQEIVSHLQIFIPEGNSISALAPNQITKSAGMFVALGGGGSPIDNHRVDTALESPVGNMVYVLSDGSTIAMTGGNTLNADLMENGTSGSTQAVPTNRWTNQYVVMFRNGRVNVQLGQVSYDNSSDALSAIKTGHTLFANAKSFGVVLAVLTVQEGDDFSNAIITNGDYFGIKI